jgi:hypothetical protein
MGDIGEGIFGAELRYEFKGGVVSDYHVKAYPPWIRLVITPKHLEFHGRGLLSLLHLDPWIVPRGEVKRVFAKQRRNLLPPIVWNVEIVTTDPSVWWTFWSPQHPEPILFSMEECGYPVDWIPHNWAGVPVD